MAVILAKCLSCHHKWLIWVPMTHRRFYTPNYPALAFHIWHDSLHRLRSYCWETARQSFTPKFFVHALGKTVLDRKMIDTFLMVSRSSITMQSLGEIELRTPTVGAKIRCLFLVCHAPSLAGCSFESDILWTGIVLLFMDGIWFCFHPFSEVIALSDPLDSSYFRR